jgi:hypothetical protein
MKRGFGPVFISGTFFSILLFNAIDCITMEAYWTKKNLGVARP